MFSSPDNPDLFNKYKQQTYRLAFPFGMVITILYLIVIAKEDGLRFYLGMIMTVMLALLTLLVWRGSRFLNTVELVFYFIVVSHFFLLTQLSLHSLVTKGFFAPETLSDQLNGLGMWLIVFMVGGFLTLKTNHVRLLLTYIFFGTTMLGSGNIFFLASVHQLNSSYLFRWVNLLFGLMITILLIERMGVLQKSQASTDALTGLLNRRALYRILEREVERSRRYKKAFSVIIFDLDNFKSVNDAYGHMVGDQVLKSLSGLIGRFVRQVDSFGRWGGEEFLIILPETGEESARLFAERLRQIVKGHQFGKVKNITASFGVTTYREGWNLDEMLSSADHAMYQVKQNGRDGVAVI